MNAYIDINNVHSRAEELVNLVCRSIENNPQLGRSLQVCTNNVGIVMQPHLIFKLKQHGDNGRVVAAAQPTPNDGVAAMACPAMYGLLCTVFEWFRVCIDRSWSVGPYDMQRWDFLNAVAPIPYVRSRDLNRPEYFMCTSTGFRRWTSFAMFNKLQHCYKVSDNVITKLQKVVK